MHPVLDLILTREPDCIASLSVEAPLPGCDHCSIVPDYVVSNGAGGTQDNDTHTLPFASHGTRETMSS